MDTQGVDEGILAKWVASNMGPEQVEGLHPIDSLILGCHDLDPGDPTGELRCLEMSPVMEVNEETVRGLGSMKPNSANEDVWAELPIMWFMDNIIYWNVRGACGAGTLRNVRNILQESRPAMVILA